MSLLQANQTGTTLREPAKEKRMVRSGSTTAGVFRKSCDVTSEQPQRIKEDEALPKTGCRRKEGNILFF
jgi:hypothetical protein